MTRTWLIAVAGLVGFLIGSYVLIRYALPVVLPFVMALLLAELIEPVVTWLSKKAKLPRGLAVTVVLLLVISVIGLAVAVGINKLVLETARLLEQLPYLYAVGTGVADRLADQFRAFNATLPVAVQGILTDALDGLYTSMTKGLPTVTTSLGSVTVLPVFLTNTLISVIATFFLSRDRRLIGDFLLSVFPAPWRSKLHQVKDDVWSSAMGWAKAQFMLIMLSAIMTVIGISLIGGQYAVLVGILVLIVDLLPILGTATVYLPWVAYSFVFGNTIFGVKLLVVYAIVAGVRQVLEPKLVGEQLGLHPLAILLSVYLGFIFFGALGFVVGPLLAILLKAMIKSELLPSIQD